jgi:hypothetical protein
MIPPRLGFDLFEVGVSGEGSKPAAVGCERVPGIAAGVHDGLVIGQEPMREEAFSEVQPNALDGVQKLWGGGEGGASSLPEPSDGAPP